MERFVNIERFIGSLIGILAGTAFLSFVFLLGSSSARAFEIYGVSESRLGLYMGNNLLSSWQVQKARNVVDDLLATAPEDPAALSLNSRVLFFEGKYSESLEILEKFGPEAEEFRALVRTTAEQAAAFKSKSSEHFEVFWSDPKDELMADQALEGLEAARAELRKAMAYEPPDKIRVELYPSVAAFTSVSTLTREEVETSGTIGLCKFNRIMIASPRATAWGYRWRDTLSHEYVHLVVYRLSKGLAPIWVHEGIARYLESSWRGVYGEMDVSSMALLVRRKAAGTLITLEEMSPSVAKLPSAEDTSLAFAEVGTMMKLLVEKRGSSALMNLAVEMGNGKTDREALESVWGGSFDSFDAAWRKWADGLESDNQDIQIMGLKLAEGHGGEDDVEPGELADPKAKDFARIGDLLKGRGREIAAAIEFEKAYASSPEAPGIASRHAGGLLAREKYDEALKVSQGALRYYPDMPVLWRRKGEAQLALGRFDDAEETFSEILEINPFHIPARSALLYIAQTAGKEDEVKRREQDLAKLTEGHVSGH